ncbi:MAG: TonB-dependent receptor, partial [Cyclobacteriaceae bacterium]|nr:TonB-dependent receptor [Cyclobacteriaceae bacterium]
SGSYIRKNTIVKALMFGGKEVTYQSWNGVEESKMKEDRTYNSAGLYYDQDGNELFYDREVDNYKQDHYQLHISQQLNQIWSFNTAFHYTKGQGYFEQYKQDESLSDYGLPDVEIGGEVITNTDLIRRRWLDNDFYGFTYGLNYDQDRLSAVLGGGYHYYSGDHFGEIIWAQYTSTGEIRHRYYDNVGAKKDFNTYLKVNYDISSNLNLYADVQVRLVDYHTSGIDSDRRPIDTGSNYSFFNPKIGVTYSIDASSSFYASYAVGNREPDRNDFIDSPTLPKHETLGDLEIGYKKRGNKYDFGANFYFMNYKNQLVLTGALNDVGGSIRTNVDNSYRAGIELTGGYSFSDRFSWSGNFTYGQSKIKEYVEDLNDYLEGSVVTKTYNNTYIAYSPDIIGSSQFTFTPIKSLDFVLFSKYVSKQYLDNTSDESRKLDPYFVNDIIINYNIKTRFIREIGLNLMINNVFNVKYESNGYAFGYLYGEEYRETYYYPQAGINFMAGLKLKF